MVSKRFDKELEEKSSTLKKQRTGSSKYSGPQTWRVKQTTNKGKPSANIDTVFILPVEFRAPSKYKQEESDGEEYDEEELGEAVAQLALQS